MTLKNNSKSKWVIAPRPRRERKRLRLLNRKTNHHNMRNSRLLRPWGHQTILTVRVPYFRSEMDIALHWSMTEG